MIEHNKNFYSLEELKRTRDNLEGYLDNEEVYYFVGAIRYACDEIERLNNIINDLLGRQNEALKYIGNHLSLDSRYKHGNGDEELILVRKILNKHIKELKGSDKE